MKVEHQRALLLLALGVVVAFLLWRGPGAVERAIDQAVAFVMRKLGKSEEARRQQLAPSARLALDGLRLELEQQHGIQTFIGSTLRTPEQQAVNVTTGVSGTQNSWHLVGRAVDLYPIDPDTGDPDLNGKKTDLFRKMHQVATTHGWRGLAFNADGTKRYITTSKGKVWDGGHLEFPEGLTFAQAQAAWQKGVA